jgi:hypothetical protein
MTPELNLSVFLSGANSAGKSVNDKTD